MAVDFHYVPIVGDISGESVLKQTERAINEIGLAVEESNDLAQEAIDIATVAQGTANSALQEAQNASQVAQATAGTAENAVIIANEARVYADTAVSTANSAVATAQGAGLTANLALTSVSTVISRADGAYALASEAKAQADQSLNVSQIAMNEAYNANGVFTPDDSVYDANDYYGDPIKIFLTNVSSSDPNTNFPAGMVFPAWFMVYVSEDGSAATQFCWSSDVCIYTRTARIEETEEGGGEALATWTSWRPVSPPVLTEHRTIQVNAASGDDANDGFTKPLRTLGAAFKLAQSVDPRSETVTIALAPGDYGDADTPVLYKFSNWSLVLSGAGPDLTRIGSLVVNGTRLRITGVTCKRIVAQFGAVVQIQDGGVLRLSDTTTNHAVNLFQDGSFVCPVGTTLEFQGKYNIGLFASGTGGPASATLAGTVVFTGTPTFTGSFVHAALDGGIHFRSTLTYTGTFTGKQWNCTDGGQLSSDEDAALAAIPGSAPGGPVVPHGSVRATTAEVKADAVRADLTAHVADKNRSVHGATYQETPNTLASRDAAGRLQVGAPIYIQNATTKTYVDTRANELESLITDITDHGFDIRSKHLGAVDLNTVLESGNYTHNHNGSSHYPFPSAGYLQVFRNQNYGVMQIWQTLNGSGNVAFVPFTHIRTYLESTNSWSPWLPLGKSPMPYINFYIDPVNGNDAGSGFDGSPVKTFGRLWKILSAYDTGTNANIYVNMAPGNYGDVTVPYMSSYRSAFLNFIGSSYGSVNLEVLTINGINAQIGNLSMRQLKVRFGAMVMTKNTNGFKSTESAIIPIDVDYASTLIIANGTTCVFDGKFYSAYYSSGYGFGRINIQGATTFEPGTSFSTGCFVAWRGGEITIRNVAVFNGSFVGRSYQLASGARISFESIALMNSIPASEEGNIIPNGGIIAATGVARAYCWIKENGGIARHHRILSCTRHSAGHYTVYHNCADPVPSVSLITTSLDSPQAKIKIVNTSNTFVAVAITNEEGVRVDGQFSLTIL